MTEWILPSNPSYYKTDEAFQDLGKLEWFQSRPITNMAVHDIVYMYISSPVKEIHWKCKVNAVKRMKSQLPYDDSYYLVDNDDASDNDVGPFIELEVIHEYRLGKKLSYAELKRHGLKSQLQGPSRVNLELSDYLHEIDRLQESETLQIQDAESMTDSELKKVADKYSGKPVIIKQENVRKYMRNRYIAEYVKRQADGKCQLCGQGAPFLDKNGRPYLESHHIVYLSEGGTDSIDNIVALCPNCHRKMHILQNPGDLAYLRDIKNRDCN